MMKRIIKNAAFAAAICILICFVGCSNNFAADGKDKNWAFVMVSSTKNGDVIFTSSEFSLAYPDALRADLSITLKDGKLTLIDREMMMPYNGTYKLADKGAKGSLYSVSIQAEGEVYAGEMSVTEAKMHDGSREYTLIITVADRNIYFKSVT